MNATGTGPSGERVLLLAPAAADGERGRAALAEAGLDCAVCADLDALCRGLGPSSGVTVVAEEALAGGGARALHDALAGQPPWSDLPVLVLSAGGNDSLTSRRVLAALGNVTLLERPMRVSTLVSAVQAALRARRRQYQVRDHVEALQEADRRKDEFLAMLAHELRNPLAPIRNGVQALRLRPDAETAEQVSGMMERQVAHLVRLLDDLLDVSRIARGKFELRRQRVGLAAVVDRAVEGARPALDEQGHQLELDLPPREVWLDADPVRVEQVVASLLANACRYTPPGGHIRVSAGREGAEAVVRVRDDGIGIRPEMLGPIFEKFAQADRLPGSLLEGLGLGLSLVRTLVEMHGGTVTAHSEGPGRGSEFVVRLPLATGEAPGPGPER